MKKLVDDLLAELPASNESLTIVGFSLGAMLALVASTQKHIDNLLLCSPSGYFKEYLPLITAEDLAWANEHIQDFENLSSKQVIDQARVAKGYIFAGDKELAMWPEFKQWINDLHRQTNWPLAIVPKTAHEIEAKEYQNAICTTIAKLD